MNAIAPLTTEQLAFRSSPEMRSVGELALHIADGRVDWFRRMDAPLSAALWEEIDQRLGFSTLDAVSLCSWLDRTWAMVAATLNQWSVKDLCESYRHSYQGKDFAVSKQWTLWRIMSHDIHHGGQLSEMLACQGIIPFELTHLGGHLTEPPLWSQSQKISLPQT